MKKGNIQTGLAALFLFAGMMAKAQTTQLTLKQCVETAIQNNLQVRQAQYQAESDRAIYKQAKANQLPFISGNVNHGINQGRSIDPFTNTYANQQINFANYSINTSVTIWNGSAISNNIKQNELASKASEMDWQQQKENITINVILAYLQVLSSQEQLTIARNQVEVSKAQVARLEILNASGAIAPSLLYDLRGQLSGDELNVINIKNTLETAKISLAQLMNVQYNASVQLENINDPLTPSLYDGTAENIYQTATQQLALVKAAEYRRQSAQKRHLAAKGQLYPTLLFNGGFGTNYSSVASRQEFINTVDVSTTSYVNISGTKYALVEPQNNYLSRKINYTDQLSNNFNSSLSIGIAIPILNGLRARTNITQAKIAEKRTDFEAQTVKTQLRQAVDQAYINMNTAFERYQALSKQLQDFTLSFKAAEVRFNAGVNTSVEYMLAKNNVDRTNSNFISAKYDYLLRVKVLDFYQGNPLW
ncbi:TolC family protein [Sediminibacterium roseum]|uniref:TolC family protein n=1 Tax=Sediminibacterium roseum TaxID=1978412 RepID=A0ABW9ZTW8_9BACT|nr:TolC family protein [Sediminibacterium roseum]NCI50582.1 TolC family protein [Sediminibacterium roseum]